MAAKKVPIEDRLAKHTTINPTTGCHEWTGARYHNGYGSIKATIDGVKYNRVHRLTYAMRHGIIPDGCDDHA